MNQARLARVLRNMERDGLTQIVISSTASVYYLTGYWVEPMERMLALYIRADGTCRLFANALFALEPQEGLELVLHQLQPLQAVLCQRAQTDPLPSGQKGLRQHPGLRIILHHQDPDLQRHAYSSGPSSWAARNARCSM